MKLRYLLGAFCLSVFYAIAPPSVRANSFQTALLSTYTVSPEAATGVVQEFAITNQTSTEYVTTYAFELTGNRISNIAISSGGKNLPAKITKGRNTTTVAFDFPDKVVGKNQVRRFSVSYTSLDIATKVGQTLDVSIPKIADRSLFETYSVHLLIPTTYGTPVNAQPAQFTTSTLDTHTSFRFDNLGDETAINMSFGKTQIVELSLRYHIQNSSTSRGVMEIALPPDNTFQRMYYDSIEPTPESIKRDEDGNWLAQYSLESNQSKDITVFAHAATQAIPQENAELLGRKPDTRYLLGQEYWQTSDAVIGKISRDLRTPEDIYSYVTRTLQYDYSKPMSEARRLGAVAALTNPNSSLCTEFTDLFITLARKKGIPARAIVGFAYSQNTDLRPLGYSADLLHTWPEYWDETTSSWIGVDPTWGQTTGGTDYFHHLDINRIVFAIHGISSTLPLPAGMYKRSDQETKDIATKFVDTLPNYKESFSTTLHIKPRSLLGLEDTYTISVKNTALHAAYAVPIEIIAQNSAGSVGVDNKISLIPLETVEIPVQLPRKGLFTQGTSIITVTINGQTFTHELTLKNTIRQYLPLVVLTGVVVASLAVGIVIIRRLLVPRWKR